MNAAIEWFTKSPVASNLLMVFIIVAGLMGLFTNRQEVIPEVPMDIISVGVNYLGAAPEEVENGVCVKIEEAISGLDGVKKVTSNAYEGYGQVLVQLRTGSDLATLLRDVKNRVDAIETFPKETETPIISEMTNKYKVISLAVHGDTDHKSLKRVAERIRDEVTQLEGITDVAIVNPKPREIAIEISEEALHTYGLTFDQVADAVRRMSLDLPGGTVKTASGEILLRTKGQAYVGHEFGALALLTKDDGTRITLGQIATVRDDFAETDTLSEFDGDSAIMLDVFRVGKEDALAIADVLNAYLPEARATLPQGLKLTAWSDQTIVLKDRLSLLGRNGLQGLCLVFLLLALFLKLRLALWVSLGIPVAFLGTFWLMPGFDVSINLISLFAFILVLGIVVDDAIVVGESIYAHSEKYNEGLMSAIKGAHDVAVPVTFGILTTMVAFLPTFGVEGSVGKLFRQLPIVVLLALFFSFIESKFILPRHLASVKGRPKKPNAWQRFQSWFAGRLDAFLQNVYRPTLELALRWRYVTLATGVAAFILTLGLIAAGVVRFNYMDDVEADFISASITMPQGSSVEQTYQAVLQIQNAADALQEELEAKGQGHVILHRSADVGSQPYRDFQAYNNGTMLAATSASNLGEVTIELLSAEKRGAISSTDLADRWRELTGPIPGAIEQTFTASLFNAGQDFEIQVRGKNLETLGDMAEELRLSIAELNGVLETSDSYQQGKREIQLNLKPAAEIWGITLADLGRQVRQAFYGEEAQRVQRGRDDVKVMVRYPEDSRRSLADLENMRIRTASGLSMPFHEVASFTEGRGYASIKRVNRNRAVSVIASINPKETSAGQISTYLESTVLPGLLDKYPGTHYSFEGQSAEQQDTVDTLMRGTGLAMMLIYALLAIPLRSYTQPLLIMSAIPFGLIGAVIGHILLGFNLTVISFLGIVALMGVVVNDSLVLVDFINRKIRAGEDIFEAIRMAGIRRFRPILLTSLTTFAGLMPLLMEQSVQAKFLIPMGLSLAFGVLFSTLITLILVPAGYWIMLDIHQLLGKLKPGGKEKAFQDMELKTAG